MQIPPHSHSHPPHPHRKQANIHSCKFFPSLYGFLRILFDFTQRLHFSRPFPNICFSSYRCCAYIFSNLNIFCTLHVCLCLCVSSQRERQRHRDHGDRARCWRRRNLHAFCRHGALLQVSPECQHFHFFAFSFLSFISQLLLDHLFLSASRQFCRIRPQPISISVHHTAAFLTLLQNFVTFLDAFPVVQPSGEFPSLD